MKRRDFLIASTGLAGAWPSLAFAQSEPCPPSPLGVDGGTPSQTPCPTADGPLPAWRQGMAIGQWKQIPGSNPSVTVESVAQVLVWNGTCVDPRNSTVYLLATGGHTDWSGNAVYSLDLEADSPVWVLRRASSASTPDNVDFNPDGRPSSAHTYNSQVFVPAIDRAMRFGNGSRPGDGQDNHLIVRFDPNTNDWDNYSKPGTALSMGPRAPNMQSWAVATDPANGNCYMIINPSGTPTLKRWNVGNPGTMTTIAQAGGDYGYEACAAFDSTRNQVLFARSTGRVLHTVGGGTTNPSIVNGGPGDFNGMIYVSATDRYYYRGNPAGGTIRQIDPATMTSSVFATSGGSAIPSRTYQSSEGVYNAFNYCPRLGGAYYVASYTGGVWFLRIH